MHKAGVDRRGFLAGGAGAAAALGTMSALAERAEAAGGERPNFVWFLSEDNNPYIGAYGDPVARTPTLDKLAAEGIRYESVHSAAPVCAPSRFALLTGKYAETCGPAHNMRAIARKPDWIRGFPEYLRAAGYYCTNNVKTDYNATVDLAATWDESSNRATWRNRPEGAPFFAMFSSQATHESRLFPHDAAGHRPGDGADPALPSRHADDPRGPRALLRQHGADGRRARHAAGAARGGRPGREHDRLLLRRQRRRAPALQALRERRRAARAADRPHPGEVAPPRAGPPRRGARHAGELRRPARHRAPPRRPAGPGALRQRPVPRPQAPRAPLHLRSAQPHGRALRPPALRARRALPLRPQLHAAPPLRPEHGLHVAAARLPGLGAGAPRRDGHARAGGVLGREAGRGALRPRPRPRPDREPRRHAAAPRRAAADARGARRAPARHERQRLHPRGLAARGLRREPRAGRLPDQEGPPRGVARRSSATRTTSTTWPTRSPTTTRPSATGRRRAC